MRRGDLNHNSGRLLTALVLLFSLSIGNAWANTGGSTTYYYTHLKVAKGTGNGYVYAATTNSGTPDWKNSDITLEEVKNTSTGSDAYYVWASAVRGSKFDGWDKTVIGSSNPYTYSITRAESSSVTTLTAKWTTYTKVDVTYHPSEDGIYSVTYQYNSYNSSSKTITAGDAENLSRNITSENGAQTIGSYYNDVITLRSVSGELQGWYSNKACTTELTGITNNGDGTYTYVAPQSGTASVYAKYPHVEKYYGRLTASIAEVPYSMPAGGMIFISKEASAAPVYSENAQTVDNVGMGSDSLTYYLKAQPTDKRYVFRGWYSNAQCKGTPLSTNKEYTYSFTASSTNSASPTTGNIYAAFDFNLYYMQVEATTGTSSEGLGMVLVRDNNTGTPEYGLYSTESSQFAYAYRLAPTATVYLYAKPKYGYKFSGWYDNPECTGTAIGTNNPQTYAATGTSTDPMNPDTTWLYAKFVEDATTVNITYNLPDQTKGEYTASVLDIQEIDDEYVWAFTEVFTSAGKTANTTQPQYKSEVLRLEAVCKAGYGVTSWTEGSTTKTTPSRIYDTSGAAAKTLGVTFGDAKPFMVCSTTSATTGTPYATLREALDNLGSNKMIRVVQNAYVPAGDYTIPDGVRLYILRADGSASKGKSVERSSAAVTAPTPYVTLTLGQGANIVVNGSGNIEVGAQIVGKAQDNSSASAGCNGAISGTYGLVVMNEGSTITLNGTSVLYAWGQITGKGRITANSGTTVYEIFQVTDWCGGSRAYACNDGASTYKMFPFSQYHIQNIEVPLRLKNGANEKLMAVIDGNKADDIPLVGPNTSSSMFRMNSSDAYIEKSYDAVNDRQVYRTGGNASINDFSMEVVITVSTESFILPLTNNMSVYIESGTTSITTNAIVNADARIHIAEGATLEMASGKSLYVYDSDDWLSGFVFNGKKIAPIRYSLPYATSNGTSSGTPIRTDAKIEDATILVNGTLNMKGKLYTSSGNAKIYSTATGKVVFSNAVVDANTTVYHLNTISGSSFFASVATTYNTTMYPAKLQNGDGSFVMTANAAANDQFIYSKNLDKWMKNPKTITWDANGGTTEATTMAYSQGQFLGELPAAYKEGHTLAGWFTAASGGTQIAPTTKVTANATYYAHWTPIVYNITYKDQGKAEFSSTHIDEPNAHPTKHTYGTTTTLNGANNKTGYDFGGWHTISNCKESSMVKSLSGDAFAKDITLYAKWTPQVYAITYKDKGDAAFSGTSWASTQPTTHTYGTATTLVNPSKEGHDFNGWYTVAACTEQHKVTELGAKVYTTDITLYAKWTPIIYTITWLDYNGAPLDESSTEYGRTPAYPNLHHPTREEQNGRTYEWDGWSATQGGAKLESLPTVTGDATYYAHYRIVKIVVNSNDEITEVTNVDTTTVCSGALHVAANLTTTNLILQATPISSGEIIGDGELTATNAYFDFSQQEGFKARTWYSVAVPWQVAVPHNAPDYTTPCDIYAKNGDGEFTQLKLGSTIDLIYYDGNKRATNGPGDDCWRYVEDDDGTDQVMMPGKAYMFLLLNDADTLRFVRKGKTGLLTETTSVVLHNSGNTKNANWNGIANPAIYHAYLDAREKAEDVILGYIYDGDKKDYKLVDMDTTKLVVGQAVYIQAPVETPIVANPEEYANPIPQQSNSAPRRAPSNGKIARFDVHICSGEGELFDRVVIRVDENKDIDDYIIGRDLVKFGVSDRVAQMWINRYNDQLAMNTMVPANNAVTYPLGISIPQAGEYTITPDQSQITNGDMLYLTYDGRIIWNLTYAPYSVSLEKGTNSHYGIKLVRSNIPAITTDIEQSAITNDKSQIQKVLMDDQVYILRGGEIYTTTGQKVK